MNIFKRILRRINLHGRIGNYLRSHYSSFRVARPYIIKVDEHDELKGLVAIVTGGSGAIGLQKVPRSMSVEHDLQVPNLLLTKLMLQVRMLLLFS
jgi:hypothetical protein